ncbi:MAG: SDR family oxidoreductase [Patescibacteria group bacterium]
MKILVTGADGGIGSAIVETLKSAGHEVVTSTMNDTDLTNPEAVRKLRTRVGTVDWIVCAHGYIELPEPIEKTFAINTFSLFYLANEFIEAHMIVLSSSAGLNPNGKYTAYSASKTAANAFVQAMALNRKNLKFFAVAPGPTNTEMRQRVAGDAAQMQSPSVIAEEIKKIVAGESDYTSGDIILIRDGVATLAA